MKVEKYISDLLYSVDCVVVVNFGGFIINAKDAIINENLSVFKPPRREVAFNSLLCNDDGVLISFISKKENISYEEAKNKVDNFVKALRDKLEIFEPVFLPKLGLFQMNEDKTITFTPAVEVNYNADSFGLSNFILPTAEIAAQVVVEEDVNRFTPRKLTKYVASVAAVFALGFIILTVSNYDLKNIHQASVVPSKQKTLEQNPSNNNVASLEASETESNTNVVDNKDSSNETISEEALVENTTPLQTQSTHPSEVTNDTNIQVTNSISVNANFIITNSGTPQPFVIVASCPDYECAKNSVIRFHSKGYSDAAIIHSGNRYRVTISSKTTLEELDETLDDAKTNIVSSAWVHYF